jgi:hypothetical protein
VQRAITRVASCAYFQFTRNHLLFEQLATVFGEPQFELRVALLKGPDGGREEQVAHWRHTYRELATTELRNVGDLRLQFANHGKCLQAALVDHTPDIGELHLSAVANQKRLADFVFELPHHLADCRLGDKDGGRRLGEAAQLDGFHKVAQCADIDRHVRTTRS